MTYGSATTAEHVPAYLKRIYKGKASQELILDFENRYRLIGRSPLIDITKQQAMLLEEKLGDAYVVCAGMRHSDPSIEHAVIDCKNAGATKIIGVILSPQFSSFIMEGYCTVLTEASARHGFLKEDIFIAEEWSTERHFIELLAKRTKESLQILGNKYEENIPAIFTTHSLPKRVVDKDPTYLKQIEKTIMATVAEINDESLGWYAGYQSAGHTPEEWLKPDLTDILADLARKQNKAVLIVPVQFLTDHLEILYDLDIAAKEQCEAHDIEYNRIQLPNTDPLFISALESVLNNMTLFR